MIPAPGRHGGDGPRVARALGLDPADILDLSMTLNPLAPDVAQLAAPHLHSLRHYPDVTTGERLLADILGLDPAHVVLTNGGSEAITLLAAELGGGRVAAEPDFSLYPRNPAGPVWRSNPNTPLGLLAAESEDRDDHADIWDEAFYPLATGRWTSGHPLIVGSLTKTFACPGLRLGYVIAHDAELARRVRARRPEWSVNSLGLAVLPDLLASADLPEWAGQLRALRDDLATVLTDHGFEPEPSDAPWLLVKAPGLRDRLAPHAVVVRDCSSFGLPDHVRIAVPSPDGLARLAEALA